MKFELLLLLLLLPFSLNNCQTQKHADELISENKWKCVKRELFNEDGKTTYVINRFPWTFDISLDFRLNGNLYLTENEQDVQLHQWGWTDEDREFIEVLGNGDFTGEFKVEKLSSNLLILSRENPSTFYDHKVILTFNPE